MKKIFTLLVSILISQLTIASAFTDDAGVLSIDSVQGKCPGSVDVYVQIKNFGTNTIDSVYVDWMVNGVPEASIHYQMALNAGDSVSVLLGSYILLGSVTYDFHAWTREPNGIADNDMTNDSTLLSGLTTAMSGSYTIGGVSPDFANFTDAVAALVASGICGPVDFAVRTGLYTEQVSIPEISGSSFSNTISFSSELGDSASVLLSNPAGASTLDNYTLQLNGVDHISIMRLTIERSGTGTASTVIEIANESNNVSLIGNEIRGDASVSASNTTGTKSGIFSPSTSNNNDLVISGNYFKDNANGIWVNGDIASHATGMVVENNIFNSFYVGAFLLYQSAPQIIGNTIIRNNTVSTVDFYAISIRFSVGPLQVNKNKITCYNGNYGIRLRECIGGIGTEGIIVNNFVQVGGATIARGISLEDGSADQNVFNNSVNNIGTNTTTGSALFVSSAGTSGIRIVNNIFASPGGGYGMNIEDNAQLGIIQSDNNCLYSSVNTAYWTVPQLSLADFQLASGLDANSVSGDPLFTSVSDLHVAAGILDAAGTPLALVQEDIDGDLRDPSTPDIGADEFLFNGISKTAYEASIIIYPNPTSGQIKLLFSSDLQLTGVINVRDLSGRTLLSKAFDEYQKADQMSLDLSALPQGFYLIGIETQNHSIYKTLVKSSNID